MHLLHDDEGRRAALEYLARTKRHQAKLESELQALKVAAEDKEEWEEDGVAAMENELRTFSSLMYEDEYDDTYDDLDTVGALEPTTDDFSRKVHAHIWRLFGCVVCVCERE